MATITYPLLTVADDAGAVVSGATITIMSVKDKAGTDVASHGATVSQSGANVSVDYDAEAKGEAWVVLAISKVGSTFTGLNAAPAFYLAKDSGRVLTALPALAAGANGGLPTGDASGRVLLQPTQTGVTIPNVTTVATTTTATNLTNLPTMPTDWITAAGLKADAVTEIQSGLALATQIPANFTSATFASPGVFAGPALANAPSGGSGSIGTTAPDGWITADSLTPEAIAAIQAGLPLAADLLTTTDLLTSADLVTSADLETAIGSTPVSVKTNGITTASFVSGTTVPISSSAVQAAAAAAIAAGSIAIKTSGITSASFASGTAVPLPVTPPDGYGGSGGGGGGGLTTMQVQTACANAIQATAVVLPTAPPGYGSDGGVSSEDVQAACAAAIGSTPVSVKNNGIATASFATGAQVPLPTTAPAGYGGASSLTLDQITTAATTALAAYDVAKTTTQMNLSAVDRAKFLTTEDVTTIVGSTAVAIKANGITSGSFANGATVPLPTAPAGYGGSTLDGSQVQTAVTAAITAYSVAKTGDAMTLTSGERNNFITSNDLETAIGMTPVSVKVNGITTSSFANGATVPLPTAPSGYGGTIDANTLVTAINTAGVKLAADGLDRVPVEGDINARQALAPILAASAGSVVSAGGGTILIKGGSSNTTRITATTDVSGNRTNVLLTLPA